MFEASSDFINMVKAPHNKIVEKFREWSLKKTTEDIDERNSKSNQSPPNSDGIAEPAENQKPPPGAAGETSKSDSSGGGDLPWTEERVRREHPTLEEELEKQEQQPEHHEGWREDYTELHKKYCDHVRAATKSQEKQLRDIKRLEERNQVLKRKHEMLRVEYRKLEKQVSERSSLYTDPRDLKIMSQRVNNLKYLCNPPVSVEKYRNVSREYVDFRTYSVGRINTKIEELMAATSEDREVPYDKFKEFQEHVENCEYSYAVMLAEKYWGRTLKALNRYSDFLKLNKNYSENVDKYAQFFHDLCGDLYDVWVDESSVDGDGVGVVDSVENGLSRGRRVEDYESGVEDEDGKHGFSR